MLKARNQPFGHINLAHTFLHGGDVIGHAAVLPQVGFVVEDRVGCVGVGVAWLADASGVDDLAVTVELAHLPVHRRDRFRVAVLRDLLVDHGLVRVPDEAVGRLEMREVERGDQRFEDVFPDRLARAAGRWSRLAWRT